MAQKAKFSMNHDLTLRFTDFCDKQDPNEDYNAFLNDLFCSLGTLFTTPEERVIT